MPQHVYELTFMERYRRAASPTNRCNDTKSTFVPDTIELEPCEYVLLRTTKRIQYFVRVQEVYVNSSEIFLKLLPDSPEEINFLRSLKMVGWGRYCFCTPGICYLDCTTVSCRDFRWLGNHIKKERQPKYT